MKEVYKGLPCWEMAEVPPRWLESEKASQQGLHLSWASGKGRVSAGQSWVCRVEVQEEGTGWTKKQKGESSGTVGVCFWNSREFKNRGKGKQNKEMKAFRPPGNRETSQCFPTRYATIEQKESLIYNTPLCLGQSASQLVEQSLSIILLACYNPSWGRQNLLGICYPSLAATCK